jgi:hypothetical protein
VNIARAVARAPAGDVHVTSTGYVPNAVLPPTCHVHETAPAAFAVFGPRPAAELGPLAYVTTIVQLELAADVADAVALELRDTGDVTVSDTVLVGCCVGGAVGGSVGAAVGVAVLCTVAVATGGAVVAAGVGLAAAVEGAAGAGVTTTIKGVVPGLPGTLVTRAPDVALTPSGVVAGDVPDSADAHAEPIAIAINPRTM